MMVGNHFHFGTTYFQVLCHLKQWQQHPPNRRNHQKILVASSHCFGQEKNLCHLKRFTPTTKNVGYGFSSFNVPSFLSPKNPDPSKMVILRTQKHPCVSYRFIRPAICIQTKKTTPTGMSMALSNWIITPFITRL